MKIVRISFVATLLFSSFIATGQLNGGLKSKLKDKAKSTIKSTNAGNSEEESTKKSTTDQEKKTFKVQVNDNTNSGGIPVVNEAELNAQPYADYDRLFKTPEGGKGIVKGLYKKDFTDRINFSGFYYLNSYAVVAPSNHFSSDTAKFYGGFSIEYSPEKHNMQVHWEDGIANYAMVPEKYEKSADKGNVMFQFGMQGGPESYYNAECLLLEPGVILIGAYVYHKNDEVGHQWMNDAKPTSFVIAAKDTSKFRDYQTNPEYTSKVVFEKFDALRRVWKQGEIEDARPLPTEGMKNETLKSEALALIQKTASAYQWKETVEYAYITSTEWDTRVSALTGKLLTRSLKCIVVMKTPDGNYKREGFYIGQKHNGSAWGNTYMLYNDQFIYYVNPKDAFKYKN